MRADEKVLLEKFMKNLDLSEEEALELLQSDKEDKKIELTGEQKKVEKEMRLTGQKKKPLILDNKPRARKKNPVKNGMIRDLKEFLSTLDKIKELQVLNEERLITFKIGEKWYDLTLAEKRKER